MLRLGYINKKDVSADSYLARLKKKNIMQASAFSVFRRSPGIIGEVCSFHCAAIDKPGTT